MRGSVVLLLSRVRLFLLRMAVLLSLVVLLLRLRSAVLVIQWSAHSLVGSISV